MAVAGQLAGKLFEAQAWLGLVCGLVVLMGARDEDGVATMGWAGGAVVFVLVGMLCALLQEFAVAPKILARQDLAFWHKAGTALYAAQWICAAVLLWKISGRDAREGGGPEGAYDARTAALDSRLRGNDG
jgi:hypothetical protein